MPTKRRKHWDSLMRLIAHAMRHGGEQLSRFRFRWDISGNCQSGYCTELYAAPSAEVIRERTCEVYPLDKGPDCPPEPPEVWLAGGLRWTQPQHIVWRPGRKHPLLLELTTRCRKCDPCRKIRASLWRMRAKSELLASARTWLGTLTLSPEEQCKALYIARDRFSVEPGDFEAQLTIGQQLVARHNAVSPEITKFLKRVREQSGADMRYLLVMEAHASMMPHYHLLLHELRQDQPIRKALLEEQWRLGFSHWRLVDNADLRSALYVTKYLSKSAAARVRASLRYGENAGTDLDASLHRKEPGAFFTDAVSRPQSITKCEIDPLKGTTLRGTEMQAVLG